MSASADTLSAELAQCAQVQDSLARLVCFDDLAISTKPSSVQEQTSIPTRVAKITPATVPAVSKEASFGAEHLKKLVLTEDERQIVFIIEKLKKDQYGKWRFTFENGQQWKQADSNKFRVKVGERVLLKKGVLNAVYLKKNIANSNKKIRVKRIK
jgi:hypothetical protein